MSNTLLCGTHGEREARFVCDHIFLNQRNTQAARMRYFEPEHAPDEPSPAIWCDACEVVILEQGVVNDIADAFAKFHSVCDFCFQKYLDGNDPAETA